MEEKEGTPNCGNAEIKVRGEVVTNCRLHRCIPQTQGVGHLIREHHQCQVVGQYE